MTALSRPCFGYKVMPQTGLYDLSKTVYEIAYYRLGICLMPHPICPTIQQKKTAKRHTKAYYY